MKEIYIEKNYNHRVASFIEELQAFLEISEQKLAQILGYTTQELKLYLEKKGPLEIHRFARLSQKIGFNLENFENNTIDLKSLKQHHSGNREYVPEKYLHGAKSKNTMIINVFNYVEKYYGKEMALSLFRHLHIDPSIKEHSDQNTNFLLFEDAVRYLKRQGLDDLDIYHIGLYTITTNKDSDFSLKMGVFKTPKHMYQAYIDRFIQDVEQNNSYKLAKLTDTSCVVESHEREEMQETFKIKHIGGFGRCMYRVGGLAGATMYMGLPPAAVKETHCVHRGDSSCKYHIDFEKPLLYKLKAQNVH